MNLRIHRYEISDEIPVDDIKNAIFFAIFATEYLHGEVVTKLEVYRTFHEAKRYFTVEINSRPGRDLSRLFAGVMQAAYGQNAYRVFRSSLPADALSAKRVDQ